MRMTTDMVAVFECVLPLQTHLVALHVDVKVLLVNFGLQLCRFRQSVEHLADDNTNHKLVTVMLKTFVILGREL